MLHAGHFLTAFATTLIVVASVIVHYEGLRLVSDYLARPKLHERKRIVMVILCLILMHVIEIWLFGAGYYVLLTYFDVGELVGIDPVNLFDCIYYSAMSYTTIGFGDIVPLGPVRLLTGMEGLTGLVLITWSASYTFALMLKTWKLND